MRLDIWQVDAFARETADGRLVPFSVNPAAVVPLARWLPDATLQGIALENNLSETAFLVPAASGADHDFHVRWFTPAVEVPLCGHATLAGAWVVHAALRPETDAVVFRSASGLLRVERGRIGNGPPFERRPDGDRWRLDFPALPCVPEPDATRAAIAEAIGAPVLEVHGLGERRWIAVLADAASVAGLKPDFGKVAALGRGSLFVTAGTGAHAFGADIVSRNFAPNNGVGEDPATGAMHCTLVPFWAARLGKTMLTCHQASARGGTLVCELAGERVLMAGRVAPYLTGSIVLDG